MKTFEVDICVEVTWGNASFRNRRDAQDMVYLVENLKGVKARIVGIANYKCEDCGYTSADRTEFGKKCVTCGHEICDNCMNMADANKPSQIYCDHCN